jgi:hypothetical protein
MNKAEILSSLMPTVNTQRDSNLYNNTVNDDKILVDAYISLKIFTNYIWLLCGIC